MFTKKTDFLLPGKATIPWFILKKNPPHQSKWTGGKQQTWNWRREIDSKPKQSLGMKTYPQLPIIDKYKSITSYYDT